MRGATRSLCLLLLLWASPGLTFEARMLHGKWINSDLDQLDIRVVGKNITLTRDLKWDGLRPSSRRVYQGVFKDNFIPLLSVHQTPHDYSEIIPEEIRQQLLKEKQRDQLIIKMLNNNNLRIDYQPTVVSFDSQTPNAIKSLEQPRKEIVRYKRWGRFTIEPLAIQSKPLGEIQAQQQRTRQQQEKILRNQAKQLLEKQQNLLHKPTADAFTQAHLTLLQTVDDLNANIERVNNTPAPRRNTQEQTEAQAAQALKVLKAFAKAQKRQRETLTKKRNDAIQQLAQAINTALDNGYQHLPKLLMAQRMTHGQLNIAAELATKQAESAQTKARTPTLQSVVLHVDKKPLYRATRETQFKLPEPIRFDAHLFRQTRQNSAALRTTLKTLLQQTRNLLSQGHTRLKAIDKTIADSYVRKLQADPTHTRSLLTTFKRPAQTAYVTACLAHAEKTPKILTQYVNILHNQWLYALQPLNRELARISAKKQTQGEQVYLAAMQGKPTITQWPKAAQARIQQLQQIGERLHSENATWLKAVRDKDKKLKRIQKRYNKQVKLNKQALVQRQKNNPAQQAIQIFRKRVNSLQQLQQKRSALHGKRAWRRQLIQCAQSISATAPRISPAEYVLLGKALQLSIMHAAVDLYWEIERTWRLEKIDEGLLTHYQQRISQQIAQFQQQASSALKTQRNTPFQKPQAMLLTVNILHWKNAIPELRIKTHYQDIPFSITPQSSSITEQPGDALQPIWQVRYFFTNNPLADADHRSKLIVQLDFRPNQ